MSDNREQTLFVDDEVLSAGFTLIPNVVFKRSDLSRDAKFLYAVLLSYAWQDDSCFPGYDRLLADLGCGRSQLARFIRELVDVGFMTVKRRGQGKTSIYTLHVRVQTQKSHLGTTRSLDSETPSSPRVGLNKYSDNEDPEEKDDSKIRSVILDYVQDFSREFSDSAPLKSSVTRVYTLYTRSGLSLDRFISALYQAREKTKYATRVKHRMPYFLSVLEQLLDSDEG